MRLPIGLLLLAGALGACARAPQPARQPIAEPARCPPPGDESARPAPGPAEPEPGPAEPEPEPAEPEPELVLEEASFSDLPGWEEDAVDRAIPAFLRSCRWIRGKPDERPIGPDGLAGTAGDWKPLCRAARKLPEGDAGAARAFFERHFAPHLATDAGDPDARFTGYYEALMRGAPRRRGPYQWPIYRRPPELVMVHLKDWYDSPRPRRVAGRVVKGRLLPYYTRREIMEGALKGRGLELYWVTDPVDAFFAQVQGSGIVELPSGKRVRVGYAGKNGHRYTAIGRVLIQEGEISREAMSMQAIRRWLEDHPDRVQDLMNKNEAFVFFEKEKRPGAIGAQGVVLTPERSMAVDPKYMPLSAPVYVVTDVPDPDAPGEVMPWRQLVIAQDTGGAIRGPTRGDIFWGAGDRALAIAGRLKSVGRYYLLLPRSVRPRGASGLRP